MNLTTEHLRRTKSVLTPDVWAKYSDDVWYTKSTICLGHACRDAREQFTSFGVSNEAFKLLEGVIREQFPDRLVQGAAVVVAFNDHPDTTYEDVQMVLDKAILRSEEEA